MKRPAILFALVLLSLGLLGVSSAAGLPLAGSLDPSFGSGGVVTTSVDGIGGIAVQPDERIVVAGTTKGEEFVLARYLPGGSPDPSFGNGGSVETQVGDWAFLEAVALQPDGKIVVAGGSYQGDDHVLEVFTLARYNRDGSPDTSFGTDGITNTVIPEQQPPDACFPASQAAATALAILPGGDILAAGNSEWSDGCGKFTNGAGVLVRYRPDGSLDSTFGDAGIMQTESPGFGAGILVRADGEIVGGGGDVVDGYAPNGLLNLAFDPDPKLQTAGALTLQDGKIVVAGASRPAKRSIPWSLLVARYKANGRLDSTFGTHGQTDVGRLRGLLPTAVVAQKNGKLLVAASSLVEGQGRSAVVRLRPNGRLDPHFGKGGIVSFDDGAGTLAPLSDGKILVGASSTLNRLIGGNNCVVPALRGTTVSNASTTLRSSYCTPGRISRRFSSKFARGRVISTAPRVGARLPGGTKVDLVVSRGRSR